MLDLVLQLDETKDCGCNSATCSCGSNCQCCQDGDCAAHQPEDCSN